MTQHTNDQLNSFEKTNQMYPCLWFDNSAEESANFYCLVFESGVIKDNTPVVVNFEISGQKFMCITEGPHFKINPSISFYAICETGNEARMVWSKLVVKGKVMMPIDKYDWSEIYDWLQDRYGVPDKLYQLNSQHY